MDMPDTSLHGKTCLVSGATAGLGEVTARALAERGATVVVVGRNPEKCQNTVNRIRQESGNPQVEFLLADLSSQAQIRRLVEQFKERHSRLDVLVNNAGGFFFRRQESVDRIEMTFALNHLNYFLLTNLLLDVLIASAPARIVNVASHSHFGARLRFDDLEGKRWYKSWEAYGQSKLANILFTYELARRLEGSGVTVNAMHPGFTATDIGKNNGWYARLFLWFAHFRAISPEEGARTIIYLASSPEVEDITGKYFFRQEPVMSDPASYDEETAQRLWQVSAEMTGLAG